MRTLLSATAIATILAFTAGSAYATECQGEVRILDGTTYCLEFVDGNESYPVTNYTDNQLEKMLGNGRRFSGFVWSLFGKVDCTNINTGSEKINCHSTDD